MSNVTVIDMTGPEKRVLSGYHALGQTKAAEENLYEHRQSKKCTNFSLPELMHNLDLIVERCEQVTHVSYLSFGFLLNFLFNFRKLSKLTRKSVR